MIKCGKCGDLFDPSKQMAACRGRGDPIRHAKTIPIAGLNVKASETKAKAPQRNPFQSDFRLIWNEP